jgi:hypothetical protein
MVTSVAVSFARSSSNALITRRGCVSSNMYERYTGDCRADQGARDAPGRGPRENGDDGQYDQIQTAKKVELLRSHRRVISRASRAAKIPRSFRIPNTRRETVWSSSRRFAGTEMSANLTLGLFQGCPLLGNNYPRCQGCPHLGLATCHQRICFVFRTEKTIRG